MAHSFPQSASISFSAGSISYLQITAITEAGRMVAFSPASPFPALFSFSPIAFHSFLFSSCSPPRPLLPLFALCSVSSGNLLSSLSLCHFLILFIFLSFPLTTIRLFPSSHHLPSPSHTSPCHVLGHLTPASTPGCVVLVKKPLSLPGPTDTWDLFLQSVPFLC